MVEELVFPFLTRQSLLGLVLLLFQILSPLVLVLAYASIFRISWYFSPLCWCFVPISHTLVFALLVLFLIFPVLFPLVLVLNILLSAFLVSFLYGADTVPISLNANRWCLTFFWFCFPFSCQYYSMYCSQFVEKYFDHINIVLAISTIPK